MSARFKAVALTLAGINAASFILGYGTGKIIAKLTVKAVSR